MRLICPNCDAEYEVDAALIPEGGRDVQCSNCGHAWFQAPPEDLAAKAEEQALYGDAPAGSNPAAPAATPAPVAEGGMAPPATAPMSAPVSAPVSAPASAPVAAPMTATMTAPVNVPAPPIAAWTDSGDDAPDSPAPSAGSAASPSAMPPPPPAPGRSLDESLLAVLREEAERETAARKAEAGPLETQTEMGLDGTAPGSGPGSGPGSIPGAVQKKIARLRGEPEPSGKADPNRARRDLLPEIDEINSSLRAAGEPREVDQGAVADTLEDETPRASGFRRGFLTVMIVAILAAALYIAAPILAARVPATAGAMAAYVHAIDALRSGLDALARGITMRLSGLTGGQG